MIKFNKKTIFVILVLVLIPTVIIVPSIPKSYAHAFISKSEPSFSQTLTIPPTKVNVYFSDPVDIKYSEVKVLDSNGKELQLPDQHYINNDQTAISVSLPSGLKDGIYTVSTKVLDQTDGHVTTKAYFFGIGQEVPTNLSSTSTTNVSEIVWLPGAAARFPSLLGQILVTGIVSATLWLWRPIKSIPGFRDEFSNTRAKIDASMIKLAVVGSIIILVSGAAMIIVQSFAINAGILDAIFTKFGNVWILRMILSSILLALTIAIYFKIKRKQTTITNGYLFALLGISFSILLSTSLISHGAATGNIIPLLFDFFHNVFASLWIGGIIYLAFVVMHHLKNITNSDLGLSTISLIVPRFSILVIAILGAITITGPFLLYLLEGNLAVTLASVYGKILIIKLSLAASMIAFGAYDQMFISNKAYQAVSSKISKNNLTMSLIPESKSILNKFNTSIKIEAFLGIALIAAVAVLVNSGLPSSEFQGQLPAIENKAFGLTTDVNATDTQFSQTRFVENGTRVVLTVNPFLPGNNNFNVAFLDSNKNPIDMKSAQITLTPLDSAIGPITIDSNKTSTGSFSADTDFGFPGHWTVRIEGVQNKENSLNLVAFYDLYVKPQLETLGVNITEFKTSENSSTPRYPVYDNTRNKIWVGDTKIDSGKILEFDLTSKKFTEHKIAGLKSVIYSTLDSNDTLWYIDYQNKNLGHYNPDNNYNKVYPIPSNGILSSLAIDSNDTLWLTSANTDEVLKFNPRTAKFDSIKLIHNSDPLGMTIDNSGTIWIAEGIGKIASIDPSNDKITEYSPKEFNYTLVEPTGIISDPISGKIFVSEHSENGVHAISVFDPIVKTFNRILLDPSGLPYGMAFDKYHNLWVAQHIIDKVAIIDPRSGQTIEKNIPSAHSYVQWITSDSQGDIVMAEEQANALAIATITPGQTQNYPNQSSVSLGISELGFSYAEVVGPSVAGLLAIVGLFFSKSVVDVRNSTYQLRKNYTQ